MKKIFKSFILFLLTLSVLLCSTNYVVAGNVGVDESTDGEVDYASRVLNPIIVEEAIEKRTENEKHFLCDDGSYIAVKYPFAVHTLSGDGWVDAEYELYTTDTQISDGVWATFPLNSRSGQDVVSIVAGEYNITWRVNVLKENKNTVSNNLISDSDVVFERISIDDVNATIKTSSQIAEQNRRSVLSKSKRDYCEIVSYKDDTKDDINNLKYQLSTLIDNPYVIETNDAIETYNREQIMNVSAAQSIVEYGNAFGNGITLRYICSPNKINEEIVLSALNNFKAYSMTMDTDGLTAEIDVHNKIHLKDDENNTIVVIDAPYMYDNNNMLSTDVEVSLVQRGDVCTVLYTPNADWLNSSERSWPVVLDPGVSTTLSVPQIDQLDNYVYAGQYYAVDDSSPTLKVGYEGGAEHWTYWGIQDWFPTIESGAEITECSFNIKFQGGTNTMGSIGLYFINDSTLNTATLTWNNKPTLGAMIEAETVVPADLWLSFSSNSLKEYMIGNYENSFPYADFVLKYTEYCNDYNWFFSSDYRPGGSLANIPYLAVKYRYDYVNIEKGRFYLQNVKSGHYLSLLNDYSGEGASAVQKSVLTLEPTDSQTWEIKSISSNVHTICPVSALSRGLYWGTDDSVVLSSSIASDNGKWKLEKNTNGRYVISSVANPMMVLGVSGSSMADNASVSVSIYSQDDSQRWVLTQKRLPVSGSEVAYEPDLWNYQPALQCNCYMYALNNQLDRNGNHYGTGARLDPGNYSGNSDMESPDDVRILLQGSVEDFIDYVEMDFIYFWGINENNIESVFREVDQYEVCDPGMYKIAFVYGGGSYHWYRQNPDGTWSHKHGINFISNLDDDDKIIIDPQNADRGNYNVFYKYYAIKPWNVLIEQGG